MVGFAIWYDDCCIHEETGFDAENVQDLYDDVRSWWDGEEDGFDGEIKSEDVIVKLFCGDEEQELTMDELL